MAFFYPFPFIVVTSITFPPVHLIIDFDCVNMYQMV